MALTEENSSTCSCTHCYHSEPVLPHPVASESIVAGLLDEDIRDAINPSHYTRLKPEPVEVAEAWNLGYHEATILKYLSRWRYKNGVEDLRKAQWFLERLINNVN